MRRTASPREDAIAIQSFWEKLVEIHVDQGVEIIVEFIMINVVVRKVNVWGFSHALKNLTQ
jgi:hypothetical protein